MKHQLLSKKTGSGDEKICSRNEQLHLESKWQKNFKRSRSLTYIRRERNYFSKCVLIERRGQTISLSFHKTYLHSRTKLHEQLLSEQTENH